MIEIRPATDADLEAVAAFVSKLNSKESDHITYLSESIESIRYSLQNEINEIPFDESFILALENDQLVGVCGMDIDIKRRKGYFYGPWIKHPDWDLVANQLWTRLHETLSSQVSHIQMAPEAENRRCQKLAGRVGLSLYKEPSYVLRLTTSSFQPTSGIKIVDYNDSMKEAFVKLHETLFPNTYYSAKEILEQLSDTKRIIMTPDRLGYLYCEAIPETGEANLDFIGVDQQARGRGYASALLSHAIRWVLSYPSIKEIDLAVYKSNPAFKLYERLGFEPLHLIIPYEGPFNPLM